jgi:hypothetical protein
MAGKYQLRYSDTSKLPIDVPDGGINATTPLTFVGRNYPGYGSYIEEGMLHLLENFASSSSPSGAVEGQLWFDKSSPNNKRLYVNNGDGGSNPQSWYPVNGVFQRADTPGNPQLGDIWVDTQNTQLKIFNGSDFTLIGPDYAGGLKSGTYATSSVDIYGDTHRIVINYVDDNAISIVSTDAFTPNQVIDGFKSIKAGVNLTSKNLGTTQSPSYATFNGIAYQASNVQITTPQTRTISANNLLRNNEDQTLSGVLTVSGGGYVRIGNPANFLLQGNATPDGGATFLNREAQGRFSFQILRTNGLTDNVFVMNGRGNQPADTPVATMNAKFTVSENFTVHNVNTSTVATFDYIKVVSTASNIDTEAGNAVQVDGGVGIAGTLNVTGEHILVGPLKVGRNTGPEGLESTTAIIPGITQIYDIGSSVLKWNNVYASNFTGALTGNASTAARLSTPITLTLSGHIAQTNASTNQFYGNEGTRNLETVLQGQAIYGQKSTSTTFVTDSVVIYRPTNVATDNLLQGNGTLLKQSKADFLQDLNAVKLFTGAITMYSLNYDVTELLNNGNYIPAQGYTLPDGWAVCDGSTYGIADPEWSPLYSIIGDAYNTTAGGTTFQLPDLTDSFPVSTHNNVTAKKLVYLIKK